MQPASTTPLAPNAPFGPWVQRTVGSDAEDARRRRHYFDTNGTAPPPPEVVEAMAVVLARGWGNASATACPPGRIAQALLDGARLRIAECWSTEPERLRFTGGATETANALLRGQPHVVVSAGEHACVFYAAQKYAHQVTVVPLTPDGTPDVDAWAAALRRPGVTRAVAMLVNNETGALSPWGRLAAAARDANVPLVCDATQAIGRYPLYPEMMGAAFVFASVHKCGGPKGVGILWKAADAPPVDLGAGGSQERGERPGTENVAGIVGAATALDLATHRLRTCPGDAILLWRERARALHRLREAIPGLEVLGGRHVAYWTLAFTLPRAADSRALLRALSGHYGWTFNVGSACSKGGRSRVLQAAGVSEDRERGAVRLSLQLGTGRTVRDDLDTLCSHLVDWFRNATWTLNVGHSAR